MVSVCLSELVNESSEAKTNEAQDILQRKLIPVQKGMGGYNTVLWSTCDYLTTS